MALKLRKKMARILGMGALGLFTLTMNGCDAIYLNELESLERVKQKPAIVVLTVRSPLIYSVARNGERFGIDHDLLDHFADHYGLKLKYKIFQDEQSAIEALKNGEGDIVAARISPGQMHKGLLIGPAYEETKLSLFCQSKLQVANIRDLDNRKIALLAKDDIHLVSQRLAILTQNTQIDLIKNRKTKQLFQDLAAKKYDCVIAENFAGEFFLRYHGSLEKVNALTKNYSLNWLLSADNSDLLSLIQNWYQKAARQDEIMRVHDRYKTFLSELSSADIKAFMRKIRSVLPTYRLAFKDAGTEHKVPWQLVAAVAYQESHWNADAKSFTGVQGMMQLTNETAEFLGVEDRTDPLQSIWGGAKYLRYLSNKFPAELNSKDRLALTLAAYNIGFAHLRDAQKLAEKMGRNPHSWRHLREILPLLADPDYHSQTEYGYARGFETVDFVERTKAFYNLLASI